MPKPLDPLEEWLTQPGGLADKLRAARLAAGLNGKQLAATTGWPPPRISKIEKGRQTPTANDITTFAEACGLSEEATTELLDLLQQVQSRHRDWQRRLRTGQAAVQAGYHQLFAESTAIRQFCLTMVPGLLQTEEYARCPIAAGVELHAAPPTDIDAAVASRMQRQQHLYAPGKRFEFLLCEPVLRWLVCPPDVMLGQLDRLYVVAVGMPRVRFGILPTGRQLRYFPQNAFDIFLGSSRGDVALTETFTGEYTHSGDDVAKLGRILDWLWEDAVEGDEARQLITAAAEDVRRRLDRAT